MWWENLVLYQVYPRSYADSNGDGIGDLPGLISKLDHLEWLGIDALVAQSDVPIAQRMTGATTSPTTTTCIQTSGRSPTWNG